MKHLLAEEAQHHLEDAERISQEVAARHSANDRGPVCAECGRVFDLTDSTDAGEWLYGHDCEV